MSDDLFKPKKILTIDYILSEVPEEEIFLKYLGIYPEEKKGFSNPKRTDHNGDCYFYIDARGRWKFHDIAAGWNWDCFNVVEYTEGVDLKGALRVIASDFELEGAEAISNNERVKRKNYTPPKPKIKTLRVKRREWSKEDLEFWKQFGIDKEVLHFFSVSPALYVWLDHGIIYHYKKNDPCYIYHFGGYDYKLYFPFRKKNRFLQLNFNLIQGWNQLPLEGDILVITKSLKDVMCLYLFGIPAIAPMSETALISEVIFTDIYNRFDSIYTLFDFDRAGIRQLRRYEEKYELPFLLFDSSFKSPFKKEGIKDFSDHVKDRGINETLELINYVKNTFI